MERTGMMVFYEYIINQMYNCTLLSFTAQY